MRNISIDSGNFTNNPRHFGRVRDKHRRSQDFLWGCTFLPRKSWRPFLVVALKTQAKTTKLTTHTVQISPISSNKLDSRSLALPGGALTTFSGKYGPKNFFSALGVQMHPVHPPVTPMEIGCKLRSLFFAIKEVAYGLSIATNCPTPSFHCFVQHCAAISAIPELLFTLISIVELLRNFYNL